MAERTAEESWSELVFDAEEYFGRNPGVPFAAVVTRLLALRLTREPSKEQMERALCGKDETFYDGWTVRRCRLCSDPVAGGPTACERCVARLDGEAKGRREAFEEAVQIIEGDLIEINGPAARFSLVAEVLRIRSVLSGKVRALAAKEPL